MKNAMVLLLISTVVWGAGYEKTILWGGKYSGVGAAATAGVSGSDSIFYNPAGLVNSSELGDLTLNISQSSSQFKGPIVPASTTVVPPNKFANALKQESSNTASTTVPGVTYSMKLTDSFSYGLGYYAVGGTRAIYENVDFTPFNYKAKVGSEITITEFAFGFGYKYSDSLRLGLAARYTMTTAAFSSVGYSNATGGTTAPFAAVTSLDIKDIKSNTLDSIRLGAQYDLNDATKLGLAIRTETKVSSTAKASGAGVSATGTALTIAEVEAKVETMLPMAINLGVEHKLTDSWTIFGEVAHTQYSKIEKVPIDATIVVGGNPKDVPDIIQNWKDQQNLKLGGQYSGMSWPVRFGYIWTSAVASSDYARASFTAPGPASTYTLGTGQEFEVGGSKLGFDIALDVTNLSGEGSASSLQPEFSPTGTYEATSTAIHTGFSYHF